MMPCPTRAGRLPRDTFELPPDRFRKSHLLRHCTFHTVDGWMVLPHHLELTSGPINSKVRGRRWNGARTAGEIDVFQGVSERLCPNIQ